MNKKGQMKERSASKVVVGWLGGTKSTPMFFLYIPMAIKH